MIEAKLYEVMDEDMVRCNLCAHRCVIQEGKKGVCMVRENQDGKLYTLVYGSLIAQHVDPIEKKPLYHFYPGSKSFSIATPGCNFQCQWCQNSDISQSPRTMVIKPDERVSPNLVVEMAISTSSKSIAYTYSEPTIFYEYAYDIAALARNKGLQNVFVTNGYMTLEMLDDMGDLLDAANVDLKSFRQDVYRSYIGAGLKPVLQSMKHMKEKEIWLEVTTLIIPEVNDGDKELHDIAHFIKEELGEETPWHLSRFFPTYQMNDKQSTPMSTLMRAKEIGKQAGLHYIYLGNTGSETNTYCHACGQLLIRRSGFRILENNIDFSRCPKCNSKVAGVGMD